MNRSEFGLLFPGHVAMLPEPAWDELLRLDRPWRIKLGLDPTASDLHIGHGLLLNVLARLQGMGHQAVIVLGGFTACIGDPTLRDQTRPPLSREAVQGFAATYRQQIFRFLDPSLTEVHDNADWLDAITLKEWTSLLGRLTVSQLIERDDFRKRMAASQPISGHELMYPLFQGYDSVALRADLELGGNDQTFNLMMGRTLQKICGQTPQCIMTFPLLEGLDGVRKMSKSYGNTVAMDDAPSVMYGKLMSISDALMWKYIPLLTSWTAQDIQALSEVHPLEVKHRLAYEVVALYHHHADAKAAQDGFVERFSKREIPKDIPEVILDAHQQRMPMSQLLRAMQWASSGSQALRLLQQGAISLDAKVLQENLALPHPGILRVGKKHLVRILFA